MPWHPVERTSGRGSERAGRVSASRRFLAWCVHAYTAIGLVIAAGMAVLIVHGGPVRVSRRLPADARCDAGGRDGWLACASACV